MEQYNVTGMSCAACQARVEKAVSAVDGVESCAVSLLTNSMGVEGTASAEAVIKAVTDAGYGASLKNSGVTNKSQTNYSEELRDTETPKLKKRLIASVILLLPLMYVSMGHMLWSLPLPAFLDGNHVAMGLYELLLAAMIMVINQRFFISGFKGLLHRSPNMDTLVALGATASFGYSVYALFAMTAAVNAGNTSLVMYYMDQFYFESAATILTLITVGKTLEAKSKGKTTDALKSLMKLAPQTAVLLVDGVEQTVPIERVQVGDLFVVKPGEAIPVDGIVIKGNSSVNEAALTGESLPVDKKEGDECYAATINSFGHMVCRATKVGQDTTLSKIIQMVSDAAATKAPIAKIADKVSGIFVPAVMLIAAITFVVWLLTGQTVGYAIARAVSVLVISCPCALGLATPVAIMVGNGIGARAGILFKNAAVLEQTGHTQIVVLDKTGTITTGLMQVTDVCPLTGFTEDELLTLAASVEMKSEHPIAGAITAYANMNNIAASEPESFEALPGSGLRATVEGSEILAGNRAFISASYAKLPAEADKLLSRLSSEGKTPVVFTKSGSVAGIIAVADTIKPDSKDAISSLKNMGLHVVMLTGDNSLTAQKIAKEAGVDEVVASVKPDGKEEVIRLLMEHGKVAMIGDGINDAPALTRADVGMAIGAGTDIAIDAADVVLMKSSLLDAVAAIRISRATLTNIHENLFWAFFYNVIGIPLAAGCYIAAFGWTLNPMFGAAAMGLSSFCVVTNALRLNLLKVYNPTHDRQISHPITGPLLSNYTKQEHNIENNIKTNIETNIKEDIIMKIAVNGMMCGHCEAHVKKALEALDGVTEAVASHEENLVTLTTSKDVPEELIKNAVIDAGYEYIGII